jgi:uncharacterized membrane protein
MWSSLAALTALVCIAVVIGIVDLLAQGQNPSVAAAMASWIWVVNVLLVILAIVIIFMVIRMVFRGVGMTPHEYSRERRAQRHAYYEAFQNRDPAVDIARARYARGEITQDQLDQTLRQLGKSS